ncbi:hypothetical protein, partial [Amycolatopsis sp. MJM2582]|uniref:hypothetical protein n=1 Tax=Amycolatopsis sp. MJM2582 TaxID=1427749 RepID=UPI001F3C6F06
NVVTGGVGLGFRVLACRRNVVTGGVGAGFQGSGLSPESGNGRLVRARLQRSGPSPKSGN